MHSLVEGTRDPAVGFYRQGPADLKIMNSISEPINVREPLS